MKTNTKIPPALVLGIVALTLGVLASNPAVRVCFRAPATSPAETAAPDQHAKPPAPTKLILIPHQGETPLDRKIVSAQQSLAAGKTPDASLETLGWLFIEKARVSYDPGFFKLAEQCALDLEERSPGDPAAMLLRGHVLQNLHQFRQAEPLARELVAKRGAPFDFGLLGDVLADLGKVADATAAYQRMMDLRPDSQALARAAHIRWIKGDVRGATDAMREAARIVGTRNAASAAWMNARLAFFLFQSDDFAGAELACASASECVPDFSASQLVRGRMQLADGKFAQAAETLQRAVAENPLPEHQWLLSEALRAAGREREAAGAEEKMATQGAAEDPRTVALFLATRGEKLPLALSLAERELGTRGDVFTHDAVAWALAANGRNAEAWTSIGKAMAEGTQDARIFLHAAVIAANLKRPDAPDWLTRARRGEHLLLPSEREHLRAAEKHLAQAEAFTAQK